MIFGFGHPNMRWKVPSWIKETLPLSTVRTPSRIVYCAIDAESLRIVGATINHDSFSTAVELLNTRMSMQGVFY